ncbi:MAG: hypothetical protein MI863_05415 [Desulfobacterales bacterium]|nr:hypothetical protein [Desulfobacterales bacterium]
MVKNAKIIISALLLVCLPLFLSGVRADQHDFSGRVVSIDRDLGTMTLILFRAGHHGSHGRDGEKNSGHGMHRGAAGGRTMKVVFHGNTLPGFVKKGEMVRIKGGFSGETPGEFRVDELLPFKGAENDPTGVRQRLMKHH